MTVWTEELIDQTKDVLSRNYYTRDAALEMGISLQSLKRAFQKRGLSPSNFLAKPDFQQTIPDGHRIKGNSTLLDDTGETLKRWVKTERDSDNPSAIEAVPPGHLIKKVSTLVDGQGQVRAQWIQAPKDEVTKWDNFWKACETSVERYRGLSEPLLPPDSVNQDLMTVYPLGDPHVGMLAWARETGQDFDSKIAERDLVKVVDMLVDRAPASRIGVLANVGDFAHADNQTQLTPNGGNKLDVDSRWTKIAELMFVIKRRLLDKLLSKHEHVVNVDVPGNHDPLSARMISFWVKAVYENEPRLSLLDNANPIMYMRHGKVLLGFAHGDGMKPDQMPSVMAAERAQDWGESTYRMWITGHVHHLTRKEYPGCIVESFRTLAPEDAWAHWKGFRSGQSLCSITFDKEWGEIHRSTVDLRFARASLP